MGTATLSTVLKAVRVLELFREHPDMGVTDCAQELGIPRPSAHRMLSTLATAGVLERTEGGRYRLGLLLFEIGALCPYRRLLYDGACLPLEELVDATGLPAHLGVLDCDEVLYVVKAHRHPWDRARTRAGSRDPLHATAPGKVLLAHADDELRARILGSRLERYTPHTITRRRRLTEVLAEVRATGIAYDREELRLGLVSIAAPVRKHDGEVIAAASISGPSERFGRRLGVLRTVLGRSVTAIEANVHNLTPDRQARRAS